jgi:hypothetical protein
MKRGHALGLCLALICVAGGMIALGTSGEHRQQMGEIMTGSWTHARRDLAEIKTMIHDALNEHLDKLAASLSERRGQEEDKDPNDTTGHSTAARRASSGHERRTLPGSQVGFDYSSPSFRPFTCLLASAAPFACQAAPFSVVVMKKLPRRCSVPHGPHHGRLCSYLQATAERADKMTWVADVIVLI